MTRSVPTSHGRNAAESRTQPFALMSRLSLFGVPRAQTLAVFTLTEAIPGLVGWRELFANRSVGGVRTAHNLLDSVLEQLGREQFS
jgi:hypothetical protein